MCFRFFNQGRKPGDSSWLQVAGRVYKHAERDSTLSLRERPQRKGPQYALGKFQLLGSP